MTSNWVLDDETPTEFGDWVLGEEESRELEKPKERSFLEESPTFQFGKAAVRGLGQAAASVIERGSKHAKESSLPALLGMPPSTATEDLIARKIRENIPEESTLTVPRIVGQGIETVADPASWIGGPATAFAMGATGKALEEAGAPKWAQIAGELAIGLFRKNPTKVFSEKSPEIIKAQEIMKAQGLGEKEITLATNALKEKKMAEKLAKMYKSTEQTIENTKEGLQKGVQNILSESFPGFEKGIEEVEKRASSLFKPVETKAKQLIIEKPKKFTDKTEEIIDDIKNTLANSPDEEAFIKMLEKARNSAVEGRTADTYVNFYRMLNRIGKWVDPSKKERYMADAKNSIKETFRENGKLGNELANEFEKANSGYVRMFQAQKVNKILEKAYVDEKLDFTKLSKSLSRENNFSALQDAVGETAAQNFKLMSKIGEQVERSAKAIEGGTIKQTLPYAKAFGVMQSLLSFDPSTIATTGFAAGSLEAARYVATQLISNPKYQQLWLRMADQMKRGSFIGAIQVSKELEDMTKKDLESIQ